ncbi:MAG: hypothetical protein HFF06_10910 [Oscillospiraceae bacterium]|nr:hypothetical protein [Oscillospiraceae bacterium]
MGDVTSGKPQGVQSIWGVKLCYATEIVIGEIGFRGDPAANQQHIANAGFHGPAVENFNVEIVQFLQRAILLVVVKLVKIVGQIVLHGVFGGR